MVEGTAEKTKEGTKDQQSDKDKALAESERAAAEMLKEVKAEEADETKKSDEEKAQAKADADKKAAEAKAVDGDGASDDDSESQAEQKKKPKSGFERRTSRLVSQRNEAQSQLSDTDKKLRASEDASKLKDLRIAQLEGQTQARVVEPDPDKFDGGEIDPDYVKQKKEFDQANIKKMVSEQVAEVTKRSDQTALQDRQADDLKKKQEEHWKQADEMGNQDYDEKEEKLIDLIGKDMVNHIIANCKGDSHKVVYYLGANEGEAADLGVMLKSQSTMVEGVLKLGQIQAKLASNPQLSITPDPDEETQGSSPSAQESLQFQLEKLREAATKPGNKGGMRKILDFKKRAEERGIALI